MDYRKAAWGLGLFSIALGAFELLASRRIAEALDAVGHDTLVKGFGVREIVAGAALLAAPAHAINTWNRVGGDGMDMVALAAAAKNAPRNAAVWGALVFVASATLLDVIVARGLDATTGKTLPIR